MVDTGRNPEPDLAEVIGGAVRATRIALNLTERELARRLGSNQGAIQRLEGGRQRHVDARLASQALRYLGLRFMVSGPQLAIADRKRQRDAVHARCAGYVARELRRRGWAVILEAEIGRDRPLGWIDLLAYREADRALLCIEIKTELDDVGRILRTLGWYARSSREVAATHSWRPRIVVPALLVLATVETDARMSAQSDVLRAALPGGSVDLSSWIEEPSSRLPQPSVANLDPRSRRRVWLVRTRADGRRSPAPYTDYRDAARRIGG